MTRFRGIPDPIRGDVTSMYETVHALKEAVERDAQGLRTRSLPSADAGRALAQQRINVLRPGPGEASLADLRIIVAELQVTVAEHTATLIDHEERLVVLEP